MQKLYIKRLESFKKSLSNIEYAKSEDKTNLVVLSGVIMMFNLSFDLGWKLIKDILNENYGLYDFPSGSPRETLKKAASVGLIDDDKWFDMLDDRNDLMHDYDFDFATKKYDMIINTYLPLLQELANVASQQSG